jgi:phage baseplate assembly protein V
MKLRFGRISEVDTAKGLVRVTFPDDNIVSPWMSAVMQNTKDTKFSSPFDVQEHVVCAMDEDCEAGVVLGALYSKAAQPSITDGKYGVTFKDGSTVVFDPANGKLTVDAKGTVEIKGAPKVVVDCDLEVKGKIDATGNVTADGEVTARATSTNVKLSTHMHPTAATGPPSPPTPGT